MEAARFFDGLAPGLGTSFEVVWVLVGLCCPFPFLEASGFPSFSASLGSRSMVTDVFSAAVAFATVSASFGEEIAGAGLERRGGGAWFASVLSFRE